MSAEIKSVKSVGPGADDARLDLDVVPEAVFTDPQVAVVGLDGWAAGARDVSQLSCCAG